MVRTLPIFSAIPSHLSLVTHDTQLYRHAGLGGEEESSWRSEGGGLGERMLRVLGEHVKGYEIGFTGRKASPDEIWTSQEKKYSD